MNRETIAQMFQMGGQVITTILRNRSPKPMEPPTYPIVEGTEVEELDLSGSEMVEIPLDKEGKAIEQKATSIEAGCVPCAIGHLGTCTGVLNEAMRFARSDGINSAEVIDRVSMCMDEISALERIDLRPEMLVSLPPWERKLANNVLNKSRGIRHRLEGLGNVSDLEDVAAETQTLRKEVGRAWFQQRLSKMSDKEKTDISKRVLQKLEEGQDNG